MINNVISLATVPIILAQGAAYQALGVGRSRGTLPFQLAGNVAARRPRRDGVRAHAARAALRLRRRHALAAARSAPCRSAGRSAPTCPRRQFDTPLDYEELAAIGAMLGHGGIVVFDDTVDMGAAGAVRDGVLRGRVLRQVHAVPHRLGARRRGDRPHPVGPPEERADNVALLEDLCDADDRRLALRAGRHDAVPGAERPAALPGGLGLEPAFAPAQAGGTR